MRYFHSYLGPVAATVPAAPIPVQELLSPVRLRLREAGLQPAPRHPRADEPRDAAARTRASASRSYQPTNAVVKLPPEIPGSQITIPRERRLHAGRRLLALQLGAVLPRAAVHRQRAEPEPALRRGARLVPLHLQPDRRRKRRAGRLGDEQVLDHQAVLRDDGPQYVQQRIDKILRMLAGDTTVPGYSAEAQKALEDQVRDWRTHPFEPHRIANYRTVAYQKTVVMKYLDNLIAWGDYLFRQDSMESINEATQLYILAAEMLGPRPKKMPPQAKPPLKRSTSWNRVRRVLEALVEVENLVPPLPGNGADGSNHAAAADALLLHPAERQAAWLLGHGRGPAVQDPPLHEHRGRGAAAGAVRAADRPRRLVKAVGGGHRHQRRARRPQRAAAALSLPCAAAEGQRGVRRRQGARQRRCSRRWRKRMPKSSASCARARRSACSRR